MSKFNSIQSKFFKVLIICIIFTTLWTAQSCRNGYYLNNGEWKKCNPSCKAWTTGTSWKTCEDFMLLDTTTQLWTFCEYGEYYDHSMATCRDWSGSCKGNWQYQSNCYECTAGEMLDTDTLTCVQACEFPKIVLQDSQFTIPSICRGTSFYVDPSSKSILELGTYDHPYHTMRSVMIEILNHHSNMKRDLVIYLKEGEEIYIEDETNYVMNITSLTITSYSDENIVSSRATLIPTKIPQSTVSGKAAFSILANTDLRLNQVIAKGGFTSNEKSTLALSEVTIFVVRSSIYIDNVDFIREYIDYGKETHVIYLVYLQKKS